MRALATRMHLLVRNKIVFWDRTGLASAPQPGPRYETKGKYMRKFLLSAGIVFVAVAMSALPSKADTVDFTLTGGAIPGAATFSLPSSFVPAFGTGTGPYLVANVTGTLLGGNFTYPFIELGISATGQWAFGQNGVPGFDAQTKDCKAPGFCPYLGIFTSDLFTVSGGTVTLNTSGAAFQPGGVTLINNMDAPLILTATDIPSPPVGTPEPASILLLGFGGLSLLGLRHRKTA